MDQNIKCKTSFGEFTVIQHNTNKHRVVVACSDEDVIKEDLDQHFKHLGKFETIALGISTLVNSINLAKISKIPITHNDLKEIDGFKRDDNKQYYIYIYSKEEANGFKRKELTVKDIKEMVENIEKFYSIRNLFNVINTLTNVKTKIEKNS
jgi:hypothetical protein